MIKVYFYFCLMGLFIGCKGKPAGQTGMSLSVIDYPVTIDLGALETEAKPLSLSEIATGIEYIPLSNDSIVGQITNFQVTDSFVFIEQAGRISSFRQSGKFWGCFPPQGRGPGEDYARCMAINEKDRIVYVFGNYTHQIMPFNYEGKWLKTSIPNNFGRPSELYAWGDKLFSITADMSVFPGQFFSTGMNTGDGSVFFKYSNPYIPEDFDKGVRINGQFYGFQLVSFQTYQDSLVLFRDSYSDTLYQTSDFKTLSPRYIFHSEKNKRSYMDELNVMCGKKATELHGYKLEKVLETDAFLFFRIGWDNGIRLGVYEKTARKVRFFKGMVF